jgi:hypothetical protein
VGVGSGAVGIELHARYLPVGVVLLAAERGSCKLVNGSDPCQFSRTVVMGLPDAPARSRAWL